MLRLGSLIFFANYVGIYLNPSYMILISIYIYLPIFFYNYSGYIFFFWCSKYILTARIVGLISPNKAVFTLGIIHSFILDHMKLICKIMIKIKFRVRVPKNTPSKQMVQLPLYSYANHQKVRFFVTYTYLLTPLWISLPTSWFRPSKNASDCASLYFSRRQCSCLQVTVRFPT